MFNYKNFVLALSRTRCNWVVEHHTEEAGTCASPYTEITIHCEYEDDDTLGFCKEITRETVEIFEKYGFTVNFDYESSIANPILQIS